MSFLGLDIAISALRANQYALNVTGHNISNASTEGYHRQEPVFTPALVTSADTGTIGQGVPKLGTGVNVETVRRMQSSLVDTQLRHMNQFLGSWTARNTSLKQVETVLAEPGESGLASSISKFWNAWEDLTSGPESISARISVTEAGVALCERFKGLHDGLYTAQLQADQGISSDAFEINTIAQEIAKLNFEITQAPSGAAGPNDLLDKRDVLLDQLSNLVDIQTFGTGGNDYIVSVGGQVLVQGSYAREITTDENAGGWHDLVWSDDGSTVEVSGGEVAGLMQVRDSVVTEYLTSLDEIATDLMTKVNDLHTSGVDLNGDAGVNFFTGTDAASMSVETALIDDPKAIAASSNGDPGNNDQALAIAALRDDNSIGDAYNRLVVRVGAQSSEAETQTNVHETSLQYLQTQREELSGVSLDEEMINLVKFQQGYSAAARIVTVVNEMMDTVINRMGV